MKRDTKITLQKAVTTVFTTLLALMLCASTILMDSANVATISKTLGQATFRLEEVGDGSNESSDYYPTAYSNLKSLIEDSREACEQTIEEGAVLLKNENNALPLTAGNRKVSLFGITSVDPVYGGTGSGQVDVSTAPTMKQALERNNLFTVNETLWNFYVDNSDLYKRGTKRSDTGFDTIAGALNGAPWEAVNAAAGSSFSAYSDAAIIVLGRIGGEGNDLEKQGFNSKDPTDSTNGDFLALTPKEKSLLEGVAAHKGSTFKRIIVIINTANMLSSNFVNDPAYKIDAALWIGTPGQTGLYGVADLLAGNVTPSGHLTDTIWADNALNPVNTNLGYYSYGGDIDSTIAKATEVGGTMGPVQIGGTTNSGKYLVYQEGIYLGYRYTETRYEDYVMGRAKTGNFNYSAAVAYPFGYGGSYTTFEYSNFTATKTDDHTYTVKVDVKNAGEFKGKDVVQVYVQKPYIPGGIEKASVELIGFEKTKELAPGETQNITVLVDERYFASYDANDQKTYVLDDGAYYLALGNGAHDAVNNILAAKGYSPKDGKMDAEGNSTVVAKFDYSLSDEGKLKYSWSEGTNKKITNLFDSADINKYEGRGSNSVTYVSRNDWEGTVKLGYDAYVKLQWTTQMGKDMETKAPKSDSSEYPTFGNSAGLQLIDMRQDANGNPISFDDTLWDTFMDQLTWDEMINVLKSGARHTKAIESVGKIQTLDHNGPMGLTEKYGTSPNGLAAKKDDPDKGSRAMGYPAGGIRASSFNKENAYYVGNMIGEEALWAGYNGLYGPGSNLHRSAYSGRNFEYYSEDPFLSGMICAEEVKGMQSHGMYVYNKHCFMNDQETARMGICIWANEQAIRELYGRAFELPIVKGDAKNVMVGYNRLGTTWCGASKALITDFLRGECGMDGFAITDMWYFQTDYYMSIVDMMYSGCDMVDGNASAATVAQLDEVKTSGSAEAAWAVRNSAKRILYTVCHSNAMNGIGLNTRVVPIMPAWQKLVIAIDVILGVLVLGCIAWSAISYVRYRRKNGE